MSLKKSLIALGVAGIIGLVATIGVMTTNEKPPIFEGGFVDIGSSEYQAPSSMSLGELEELNQKYDSVVDEGIQESVEFLKDEGFEGNITEESKPFYGQIQYELNKNQPKETALHAIGVIVSLMLILGLVYQTKKIKQKQKK